jgi:hypothetical protein
VNSLFCFLFRKLEGLVRFKSFGLALVYHTSFLNNWRLLESSNSVIFADDDPVDAVEAGVPVFGWGDFLETVELADVFEALIDELPGALAVGADLATVLSGAAARAVEQMFGAARDGQI